MYLKHETVGTPVVINAFYRVSNYLLHIHIKEKDKIHQHQT